MNRDRIFITSNGAATILAIIPANAPAIISSVNFELNIIFHF
jgi:hypothetical protein